MTTKLTTTEVITIITKVCKKKGLEKIVQYFNEHHDSILNRLWGEDKSGQFVLNSLYCTLLKDITHDGYTVLLKRVHHWYKIGHNSYQHNVKVVRKYLASWADSDALIFGSLDEWNKSAKICKFNNDMKNVCLWMDSTDIRTTGIRKKSKRGSEWSYKLNAPGRRWMVIQDAKRRVIKLYGGYSPKTYDGSFLEMKVEHMEQAFKGATIIADNHFSLGRKLFKNVKFLVNWAEKKDDSVDGSTKEVSTLTEEKKSFNTAHRKARARVESPFGSIKTSFKCFSCWREDMEQMDYAVKYTIGFHNINIK